MTEVSLEHLTRRFPGADHPAVDDVSVSAPAGGLLCLLGPSGCGKTTTLKMIAGLETPDRGRVCFGSRDVTAVRPERRDTVLVFQNYLLFPFMNVEENVGFGLRMRGMQSTEIQRLVDRMLEAVRLDGLGHRKPEELSGGQKQRVALARALVLEPSVLLLDEPFSNLDAHLRDEMRDLILQLKEQMSLTIVFVTHDQEEAVLLADRIALMFDGRIRQVGGAADFFERPATRRIAAFFGNRNVLRGRKRGNRVETAVGEFAVAHAESIEDGPVDLLVRPEFVETRPEAAADAGDSAGGSAARGDGAAAAGGAAGSAGDNLVSVVVKRCTYMGTHVRYRVTLDSTEWEVHAPGPAGPAGPAGSGTSDGVGPPQPADPGTRLMVRLPPERIWLVPAEAYSS
ncbi:MAG: ATP-binding cassette domain-containing protein [Spirochaetes bacterium]|jgi:ABC-type Fe3+/spermidine/putrescine transport system ATPase subunit|nr:ATP-binding cassette domain-containing protein [Spirochaetota bacterium]